MISLKKLLPDLPIEYDRSVTGLSLDSRQVQIGHVFFACQGTQIHGEIYIPIALKNGAIAILREASKPAIKQLNNGIPCIDIPDLTQKIGDIAARFYNNPSQNLNIIGVTGTNGKTSITHFIAQILEKTTSCGIIGTLGYGIYGNLQTGMRTTPDAIRVQSLLTDLYTKNVRHLTMEVSSHALVQGRVNSVQFDTAVFTNLSRDHLDYHKTMAAYGESKKLLFSMPYLKTAVINIDDNFGRTILADLPKTVQAITYSLKKGSDVYANNITYDEHGYQCTVHTPWGNGQLTIPLFGEFNISNILATLIVLLNKGLDFKTVITQIAQIRSVAGRMERFYGKNQTTAIVDYAHTPDALEKTLATLRKHCVGKLYCVFGCGGDRDKGKRPLMGEIAQRFADYVIVTDDNPRHESSSLIIQDILSGCPNPTEVIPQREQAISWALKQANPKDIVLIAGKGHEDYQEIGDQRFHFSDREIVVNLLK